MGSKSQKEKIFNYSFETLQKEIKSRRFSSELNITLKSENKEDWGVWYRFHHGFSFTSYGEKITISLTEISPTSTKVDIFSEAALPTQILDMGKNSRNIANIFEYFEKFLKEEKDTPADTPVPEDELLPEASPSFMETPKEEKEEKTEEVQAPVQEMAPARKLSEKKAPLEEAPVKKEAVKETPKAPDISFAPKAESIPLDNRFCTFCGTRLVKDANFCYNCGADRRAN